VTATAERAADPAEPPTPGRRVPVGPIVAAAVLLLLAAAPFFLAPFAVNTLTRFLVFALLAVSLDLLVGVTGLPSLGHAAYLYSEVA
jgi:branched-chain amino acid transport system permease protein